MTGILPSNGVPPGSTEGGIANGEYSPGCDPLFYPPRCNPRLDPFAMNTLISEVIRALNVLGLPYDCNDSDNLATAMSGLVHGRFNYGNAGGSANAKTLTLSPDIVLTPGLEVAFRSNSTNTGAMTLNVNGLGARPIVDAAGNPMTNAAIPAGSITKVMYDGTNWVAYTMVDVVVPPAPPSLGVDQVWTNVTAQRQINTSYLNNTGKPIAVSVRTDYNEYLYKYFEVSQNNATWLTIGYSSYSSGSAELNQIVAQGPFVIPPGHYYRVRGDAGSTITNWLELR